LVFHAAFSRSIISPASIAFSGGCTSAACGSHGRVGSSGRAASFSGRNTAAFGFGVTDGSGGCTRTTVGAPVSGGSGKLPVPPISPACALTSRVESGSCGFAAACGACLSSNVTVTVPS